MNTIKNISIRVLLLLLASRAMLSAQTSAPNALEDFYIGIYVEDVDGNTNDAVPPTESVGLDDDYLRSFSDYHFNLIHCWDPSGLPANNIPPPSLDFLDRIEKSGMKAIIAADPLWTLKTLLGNDNNGLKPPTFGPAEQAAVTDALNHYGDHPAIAGYSMMDEPCVAYFSFLGDKQQFIRNLTDNKKLVYTNLWSSIVPANVYDDCEPSSVPASWDFESDYINPYLSDANPNMISIDAYPLYSDERNCTWVRWWWKDYEIVGRRAAQEGVKTFYAMNLIVEDKQTQLIDDTVRCFAQSNPPAGESFWGHTNTRSWPLGLSRYYYFAPLIHGAKGIMFWAADRDWRQWSQGFRPFWNTPGMASRRTEIGEINQRLMKHKEVLARLKFQSVFHVTHHPCIEINLNFWRPEEFPAYMDWQNVYAEPIYMNHFYADHETVISPNPDLDPSNHRHDPTDPLVNKSEYLVFSFLKDNANAEYFWVMNKNIDQVADFTLDLKDSRILTNVLDDEICVNCNDVSIHLEPGEGKLFRVAEFTPNQNPLVISGWAPTNNASSQYASSITLQSTNTINNTNQVGFYGQSIRVTGQFQGQAGSWIAMVSDLPYCGVMKYGGDAVEASEQQPIEVTTEVKVFPNPSNGTFNISGCDLKGNHAQLRISSIQGTTILTETAEIYRGCFERSFDISRMASGVYVLTVDLDGAQHHIKVVKE